MSLQQLPDEYRNRMVSEFRIATAKMAEAQSGQEYIYYFSVFFGELVRVLNWHWDDSLALIWANVQHTHNAISSRISAAVHGDRVVVLSDQFFTALTQASDELVNCIENQGDEVELCGILGKLARLAYATTGNGYYLLGKGMIKLED